MDTLMRTKKLEDLGFDRPKAEGLVQMVKASINEEVAKKVDLDQVETSLNTKIDQVETRLNTKIDQVEAKLNTKIDKLEASLNGDMTIIYKDLLLYLGSLMVTLSGIIIGVLIAVLN